MNSMIYEQPPALTGDERAQLQQLYRYLFKLSEQLNTSLEATDRQYRMAVKTRSGSEDSDDVFTPALDAQYRELRSLILKTADIVNQKMDRVVTQLNSEFQAISNEWGTFEQNIERTIIDTAENTIEQFDYSEHIYGIDKTVMDGVTYYGITSLGYIKRGIIGFDDENFPIYGIAVGTELKEKTVIKDGKEYQQIDTNQRIATYTSDRITFWANGVEMAYFSGDKLFVTRVEVTDGITIGDMHIDVNDKDGLSVGKQIGNFIDISENETMVKANRQISLVVDGSSTDTKLVLTDQMLDAIAANINLEANESITLVVKPIMDGVNALADRVTTAESQILQKADSIELSVLRTEVKGIEVGARNLLLDTAIHTVTADTSGITSGEGGGWADLTPDVDLQSLIGQELTLSGWFYSPGAWVNTGTSGLNRWDLYTSVYWTDSTGTNAGERATWPCYINGVGAAGERLHATGTVTPPAGYDTIARLRVNLDVRLKPASGNSAVWQLKEIKLEKGNRATDWTPAPEDAEGEIADLETRMSAAELKITADAIVSTVTSSTSYKNLSDTANTAKSTADSAKSSASTNASNITALTTRVTNAESKIEQKADSIELSVLRTEVEGIEVGGRNLVVESGLQPGYLTAGSTQLGNQVSAVMEYTSDYIRVEPGEKYVFQNWVTVTNTDAYYLWMAYQYYDANKALRGNRIVYTHGTQLSDGRYYGVMHSTAPTGVAWIRVSARFFADGKIKLEKGSMPTDWSPAPEDPAKSLVTGTTVTITDEKFNVQTGEASFSIIDDSSGEAEEKLRIDDDGLTAQEATFGTVHSDSVVLTQAGVSFGPANAGELQAFLDNLSNRCLTGDVNVDVRNITGGSFTVKGLSGSGQLALNGFGTCVLNSFAIRNCHARVRLYNMTFSTTGTALDVYCATAYLRGVTLNAKVGVQMDFARAALYDCAGTCTTVCYSGPESSVHIYGSTIPYGQPGMNGGEVYSSLAFANPPSAVETPTVTSTSLAATSTRTWNGSWISGNVLYQGKTGSDGQLRRGCMWFDTSAISGKTIVSATLTLKRVDGIGGGGSVAVGIYGTTAASASGTPAVGTKYASVSLANGATKSVDVTEAVKALAAGSIKGLMVYDTQTGTFNSKNYTYGYCKLYGSGDSAKPVLNVVYK